MYIGVHRSIQKVEKVYIGLYKMYIAKYEVDITCI